LGIFIVPFFSPFSSEEMQKNVLKQFEIKNIRIKHPLDYLNQQLELQDHLLYLFVGTGGTEKDIVSFVNQLNLISPISLLSYDLNNSLPAAMEVREYLQNLGRKVRIEHGFSNFLENIKYFDIVLDKIRNSRMGLIGKSSEWLIASQVDEEKMKKHWGIEIIHIPIEELIAGINVNQGDLGNNGKNFLAQSSECEVGEEDIRKAELALKAIETIVKKYHLDVVSVECFTFVVKTEITSCFALSYLNDQGLIAGCEGDMPTTFTMFLVNKVIQKPVFMSNVVDVDIKTNHVNLAHCTVPRTMVENYNIKTHFETDKSVAIQGFFSPQQEVTVVKIGGSDLSKWWVSEGRIVRNVTNESACRTQIEIELEDPVDYFFERSIANHHCVVLGHHAEELQDFLKFTIGKQR